MKLLTAIITFSLTGFFATAQELLPTPSDYFQIFLENPIQQIKEVKYSDDSGTLEFQLSEDKKAIYLLNYDGKTQVKATIIDGEGSEKEIVKNHCSIHNLKEL